MEPPVVVRIEVALHGMLQRYVSAALSLHMQAQYRQYWPA